MVVAPFKYKMGVEFDGRFVAAVLLEPAQRECRLLEAREIDLGAFEDQSAVSFAKALVSAIGELIPGNGTPTSLSLVVPIERVIQFNIQLPLSPDLPKDDWEKWEISTHLPGVPDDYLWESSYLRDSLCGSHQIRRVWATRKAFIDSIISIASAKGITIEEVHFPQSVWGKLLGRYCAKAGVEELDCVYIGGDTSYVVRSRQNRITEVMSTASPGEIDRRRFIENMETLISWHGGVKSGADGRYVVDAHGSPETLEALSSRFKFNRLDSGKFSKQLRGTVDKPERYILSLGALGVI